MDRGEQFHAVNEHTENDNFHTSIYEKDHKGLLIARCNQNGNYPWQVEALLRGLNSKRSAADLIDQQAAQTKYLENAEIAALVGYKDTLQKLNEACARIAELEKNLFDADYTIGKLNSGAELQMIMEAHNAALIRAEKAEAERDAAIRALAEEGRVRGTAEARADAALRGVDGQD